MKNTFLMAAAVAALPVVANAGLQVSPTEADLGKACYSEQSKEDTYGYKLYAVKAPVGYFPDEAGMTPYDRCADTYEDQLAAADEHCWVGVVDGTVYHCVTGDIANGPCSTWPAWENGTPDFTTWTACGNNRVYKGKVAEQYVEQGSYTCETIYDYSDMQYGCVAGYYASSGSGANITCARCPTSGGVAGQSATGNTAITGCYIPSGSNFSDSYGSGVLTGDCYYTK